ncbi:MAG: peptide chain release factor 2 [Rhodobacteraceae bacterium]|nr:peptide chain release factor 2 [Paracoccaceae bacterium]
MRSETQTIIQAIEKSLALIQLRLDRPAAESRLHELNRKTEDAGFWDNPQLAQKVMKDRQILVDAIHSFDDLQHRFSETVELIELGEEEGETEIVAESEKSLAQLLKTAQKKEIEALLNGEADANDAFIEINAGAGGTESCDWAAMLSRMYEKWALRRGFDIELIALNNEAEAGYKSVTHKILGKNAYGWLKTESGVHRLVRNSPFDSNSRRHTSFSSVWVYPAIDESIEVEINPADLRVDTFRASGAGGQHVNKTDSAVRITHLPTGIVVTSSEKSQHQNRTICMNALRSRLYELELRKRTEKIQELHSQKGDAGWGNQIRSYVLTPYQMVKDLRTNLETSNTQGVLDGQLDDFMESVLARNVTGMSRAEATAE